MRKQAKLQDMECKDIRNEHEKLLEDVGEKFLDFDKSEVLMPRHALYLWCPPDTAMQL